MKQENISTQQKGFIFLEILIAVSLVSIVFIFLITMGVQSLNISSTIQKTAQINSLMKGEMEAVRGFRDGSTWAINGLGTVLIGNTNPYYMVLNNSANPARWALQSGIETVGAFTKRVVFDKVSRDTSTQNIESTYNAVRDDPKTRKITVSVVSGFTTYQLISYLTNWVQ